VTRLLNLGSTVISVEKCSDLIKLKMGTKQKLEAGIIKKLRLENFMCHSNHETEFGNHVNVITGQNGSMLFSSSLITFTLPLYLFIFPFEIVIFIFFVIC
jgi:hypothetical protein